MTRPTEAERLAVVETKLDIVLTAVASTNTKIDELAGSLNAYATKAQLSEEVAERNDSIKILRQEINDTRKKHNLTVWLTGTLSAVLGVVMTMLVQGAFN